jgi:thymidylate synthase
MEQKAELKPQDLYLTVVEGKCSQTPDKFMEPPGVEYKLISISEKFTESDNEGNENTYRFCRYRCKKTDSPNGDEQNYLDLCRGILSNGCKKDDRTQVGTISEFGKQIRYNISNCIPLFTTKRVPWKHCIEELLWFLRGDTDAKILQDKGVKIWDGNTSREFLDGRGLHHYEKGICGPLYGWQWRFFGAKYSAPARTAPTAQTKAVGGVDQIENVVQSLKKDPYSRRHLVCAWNPPQLNEMVLPPCHFAFQFYVSNNNAEKELSCHVMMRSNDLLLGHPFNVFSYAVLTHIIGLKTEIKPKELVISITDAHIYSNHVEAVEEQIKRTPRVLPKLLVNSRVKDIPFEDILITDFDVVGYFPHTVIKAPMAI